MIRHGKLVGRLGEISIAVKTITLDPEAFELLMKNFYPIRAEHNFMTDKIKYFGYSHFFRVKDDYEFTPTYEAVFNRYPSGAIELIFSEKKGA